MIRVEVLLFSSLREAVGASHLDVDLEPGTTGARLIDHLVREFPPLGIYRDIIGLARNSEYVDQSCLLEDQDEVALIAPVSGG